MFEEINSYLLSELLEREFEVFLEVKKPIRKVPLGPLDKIKKAFKKHVSVKKQEINVLGKPRGRPEMIAVAAGLASWIAWMAYKHYKKSIADGKEPHIALKDRIMYLRSGRSQCDTSMNPPECKRRVDAQIRRLAREESIKRQKIGN